jgi:hypothetical protein
VTIHEKEALFEKLDEAVEGLKDYILDAVGQEDLHQVEQTLFRRLQRMGLLSLECFVAESGNGYEAGHPLLTEEGEPMRYKGTVDSPYFSIFGELSILRAAYAHPDGSYVYPIDAQLNLPAHKYSFLLVKWLQASAAKENFREAVTHFNEVFDFSFFPELPQRLGADLAAYVEPFYQQVEAPALQTEGSHIAVSADCKGVRILRSERADAKVEALPKPRPGKGEKPGIKKDAVVITDFSFDPEARHPEQIVKGLLNRFTQEEKAKAKQERQCRREEGLQDARMPFNKHVFATLDGKAEAFDHLIAHVLKRDPTSQKPIIALLDGDPHLEDGLIQKLKACGLKNRLDALILDIIHASEYLWDVGTALYGEKGPDRVKWVEDKLRAVLHSQVGYVIGGLRQTRTKSKTRLTPAQDQALRKAITYFENHRHMMDYASYLKKGYPISTGVVEGSCGSLVKDRMEESGMRWSIAGAQAILKQRAVVKNGDWDKFWKFYIDSERSRLYPTEYERAA